MTRAEQPSWQAFVLWLAAQPPETDVEPVEFLAAPEGQQMMPAELHHVVDRLLTHQFVQACHWHDSTPATVRLTQHGRQFAQHLATNAPQQTDNAPQSGSNE